MGPIARDQAASSAGQNVAFECSDRFRETNSGSLPSSTTRSGSIISVALLTGGIDRHYTYGLASAIAARGAVLDLIGSDELDGPDLRGIPGLTFLNLRGDQRYDAKIIQKIVRLPRYYARLIRYAASSKAKIFHILWNNKIEFFDRTLLMLYYKLLGKKVVLTAHNVNKRRRDASDTRLNRLTLRVQYRVADRIFVHTEKMKSELTKEFGVSPQRVTIIPFGINNAVPTTDLSSSEAKRRLGLGENDKAVLFFGQITPYKGLEYLVRAFKKQLAEHDDYRLVIAGNPKPGFEDYWRAIEMEIRGDVSKGRIFVRSEFIPDSDVEIFFKAADVLVLPYTHIYQSGILFLGYNFGLPALVADVGSLRDEIVAGETGFTFNRGDSDDLARAFEDYFSSDLFANLSDRRRRIQEHVKARHSWDIVGQITAGVYGDLIRRH